MKKVFLSVLVSLMSTIAMAQAPCRTVKACEALRVNAHKVLTKRNSSPAAHQSLDQQINQQIKALPRLWPQGNMIQGLQWSGVLDGHFQNLDLDGTKPVNNIIQKSDATEVCKAIGGRLPTLEDYAKLVADWNDESIVSKRFKKEMEDRCFLSSSVVSDFTDLDYSFNGYRDIVDVGFRNISDSVRCVGG